MRYMLYKNNTSSLFDNRHKVLHQPNGILDDQYLLLNIFYELNDLVSFVT